MNFMQPDRDDLQQYWRTLMVLGFLLVAAGELALCCVTMGAADIAAGPLGLVLVGAGTLHLYPVIRHAAWRDGHLQRFAAAVYLGAGVWLMCSPATRADALSPLLAACFIGGGVFQVRAALTQQRHPWNWTVWPGAITAVLGVLLASGRPADGIEALGVFAGLELCVAGTAYLGLAWSGWRRMCIEAAMGFDQQASLGSRS